MSYHAILEAFGLIFLISIALGFSWLAWTAYWDRRRSDLTPWRKGYRAAIAAMTDIAWKHDAGTRETILGIVEAARSRMP